MKQLELKLGGLFVLQIVFAAILFWYFDAGEEKLVSEALVATEKSNIDKLVVQSAEDKVTLALKDDRWSINDDEEIVATKSKVENALDKLTALKTNWPVATTTSSHNRFEVAQDKFQRKIELFSGEKLVGEFYLGTSPGFKKVHMRRAGDDEVYAQALNNYDFPVKASEWLDKSLLSAKDVKSIKREDYQITKVDDAWQWASATSEQTKLNSEKASSLSDALSFMNILEVTDKAPDFSSDKVVNLEVEGEKKWQYQFLEEDENYFVKRSDLMPVFKLSQYEYERIAKVSFDDLKLVEKPEGHDDTQEELAETNEEIAAESKDS